MSKEIPVEPQIEHIVWQEHPLCYIIRAGLLPDKTTFLAPNEFKQQVGFVAYPTLVISFIHCC